MAMPRRHPVKKAVPSGGNAVPPPNEDAADDGHMTSPSPPTAPSRSEKLPATIVLGKNPPPAKAVAVARAAHPSGCAATTGLRMQRRRLSITTHALDTMSAGRKCHPSVLGQNPHHHAPNADIAVYSARYPCGPSPVEITTDRAPVYLGVIDELVPAARHVLERYANKPCGS
jgi:hypothetical protein